MPRLYSPIHNWTIASPHRLTHFHSIPSSLAPILSPSMAAATSTTSTLQRTPTLHLTLPPNLLSCVSLQRSKQTWPTQRSLVSSLSISCSYKSPRPQFGLFLCSASSHDETLVTEDEKDVVTDESQPQPEDPEDTTTDDDSSQEESPASILASLQSYKEALADNNEPKISELETHFKSIEDEKIVLESQLATLSDDLSSAKDRILRISADFDNFRKRSERERLSLVTNAQGEVIESLLPVLDNFERAKDQIKVETEKEEKINNSYQSIYKQFVEILGSLGVVPVDTIGKPFDPLMHEAIMREDSNEFDEGVVIQEFRKGFRVGERLLRPSMVKVSAGPGPGTAAPMSPDGQESVGAPEGADGSSEDHSEPASPEQDE